MNRVAVAKSQDVGDQMLVPVKVEGLTVLLTRIKNDVVAVENKCPHVGLPLTRGSLAGTTLTCPWHGSKFDVCTGRNIDWVNSFLGAPMPKWSHGLISMGKQPAPLRTFNTSEKDGSIYIEVDS